jgi:hypothetical protein
VLQIFRDLVGRILFALLIMRSMRFISHNTLAGIPFTQLILSSRKNDAQYAGQRSRASNFLFHKY